MADDTVGTSGKDVQKSDPGGFQRDDNAAPGLFASVAGFGVSFSTMFRKVATEEYPEKPRPTAPRFHGRHQLNRHPDGLEKCIGCELCAWACPADAIFVEGADNDDTPVEQGGTGRFSPGERYGRVYQINYLRCIFCGLCIEACPTRALTMTNFYELADNDRGKLIFTKDQLLAPLQEGMLPTPFPMAEGLEERDYYQGKVASATEGQREYVDAHAADLQGDTDGDFGGQGDGNPDAPGNLGAHAPGRHDVSHTENPTAANTREGAGL